MVSKPTSVGYTGPAADAQRFDGLAVGGSQRGQRSNVETVIISSSGVKGKNLSTSGTKQIENLSEIDKISGVSASSEGSDGEPLPTLVDNNQVSERVGFLDGH